MTTQSRQFQTGALLLTALGLRHGGAAAPTW